MRQIAFNILVFVCGIIVQFAASQYLSFGGLAPNIILVALICIGLVKGSMAGQLFGFTWGVSWDVLSVDLFGSHAFLFTCLGYLSGQLSRKWNETKVVNQMVLTFFASVFFWAGMFILYLLFGTNEARFRVNYIILFQPLLNMVIAPLVFAVGKGLITYFRLENEG